MPVRVIDRYEDWQAMRGPWNAILGKSRTASPFLTFEWLSNWWRAFGAGKKLFILAVLDSVDGPPVAFAPLMVTRASGFRVLEFIGTGPSDCLDFIVDGGREGAVDAIIATLRERNQDWDLVWLQDIPDGGNALALLATGKGPDDWRGFRRRTTASPYLTIRSTWDAFVTAKGHHFSRNMRQKERRFVRHNLVFEVHFFSAHPDESVFAALSEIGQKSWKGSAGLVIPGRKSQALFDIPVLRSFAERGWLNIWLGIVNGRPAAYILNFDFRDKIWIYNTAYDRAIAGYSPGAVLMARALEDAFRRGKKEADFLRGDEPYKRLWASEKRDVFQVVLKNPGFRSRCAYVFLFVGKRNFERLTRRLGNELDRRRRKPNRPTDLRAGGPGQEKSTPS